MLERYSVLCAETFRPRCRAKMRKCSLFALNRYRCGICYGNCDYSINNCSLDQPQKRGTSRNDRHKSYSPRAVVTKLNKTRVYCPLSPLKQALLSRYYMGANGLRLLYRALAIHTRHDVAQSGRRAAAPAYESGAPSDEPAPREYGGRSVSKYPPDSISPGYNGFSGGGWACA